MIEIVINNSKYKTQTLQKKLKLNLSIRKHDEDKRNLNGFMSVHSLVYKSFTGNSLYL